MNTMKSLFLVVFFVSYVLTTINCTRPAECELPKIIGNCRALIPAFYFNPSSNTCEPFSYGGCGGNENNFRSMDDCLKRCNDNNGQTN